MKSLEKLERKERELRTKLGKAKTDLERRLIATELEGVCEGIDILHTKSWKNKDAILRRKIEEIKQTKKSWNEIKSRKDPESDLLFLARLKGLRYALGERGKKGKVAEISKIMAKVKKGKSLTKDEREYMSMLMRLIKKEKRKALSKKYGKLTKGDLEKIFAKRSKRSRSIDKKKRAKKVIKKPWEYYLWVRAPKRYDIEGIDTPKR